MKNVRCQLCDVKVGHQIMEVVGLFDYEMHNFTHIALNFTNRWIESVLSWFPDNIFLIIYLQIIYNQIYENNRQNLTFLSPA